MSLLTVNFRLFRLLILINCIYSQVLPKEYPIGYSITNMPVQYLANDDTASTITINGTITESGGRSSEPFVQMITSIQHNTLTSANLTLPAVLAGLYCHFWW